MNAPKTEEIVNGSIEVVLELIVRNHPGVMSHVCNLFSRRAYNLEGIAVLPVGDGSRSKIWLKVIEEGKLDQIIKQLKKLPDVQVIARHGGEQSVFVHMSPYFELDED